MDSSPPAGAPLIGRTDRLWLAGILLLSVVLELRGIVGSYGYIGQDFPNHHHLIVDYPDAYSYRETNPPFLYWLGSLLRHHVTATYYLEALALLLLALNTLALWGAYHLIWEAIPNRALRFAAAALVTLVPFRMVHAIVISADALTYPVFVAAALATLALWRRPRQTAGWVVLAVVLSLGVVMKYSLVGLLPPVALALAPAVWRSRAGGGWVRPAALGLAALALPSALFLWEMRESDRVQGSTTYGHWKVPGTPSIMRWEDILLLKPTDPKLLSAPEYFRDRIYENRAYSYAGLLHLATFTDTHNYLQTVPSHLPTGWKDRLKVDPVRFRTPLAQRLQAWAVRWTLPLSLLAVAGTLLALTAAIPALLLGWNSLAPGAALLAALGFGVYAPIFFSFTSLGDPYTPGYWLPRLVLPAVLSFLCLGLWLVGAGVSRLGRWPRLQAWLPRLVLTHVLVACALFVGFGA